jgi:hypothetical protein
MDLAYLSYLAAHSETGAALFTSDEWNRAMREGGDVRSRGVAAFTLGAHDRRAGNPPRSLAEVTREAERMLSAEPGPETGTVLGKIVAAWGKADTYSAAGAAVGDVLNLEGYATDDGELTQAGRALAGLS